MKSKMTSNSLNIRIQISRNSNEKMGIVKTVYIILSIIYFYVLELIHITAPRSYEELETLYQGWYKENYNY